MQWYAITTAQIFSLLYCVIFFLLTMTALTATFSLILWVWFSTFMGRTALEAEHKIVSYHLLEADAVIGRSEQVESREVSLGLYKWSSRKVFTGTVHYDPSIHLTTFSDVLSRTLIFQKKRCQTSMTGRFFRGKIPEYFQNFIKYSFYN